jgi:signal peptide peptidase SppA
MATATTLVRRDLRALLADESVKSMLIHVESPGGASAGTAELFDEIHAAAKRKTVWAYIDDLGASAAYWAAAGADRIVANAAAKVGSIGTYAVIVDQSREAAARGLITHVVKAGKFKGMGTAGTQISTEQLAELQRIVDGVNDLFLAGVAKGRRMSIDKVRDLADGRVHLAADALKLGLIDARSIPSRNTVAKLRALSAPKTARRSHGRQHLLPARHTRALAMSTT